MKITVLCLCTVLFAFFMASFSRGIKNAGNICGTIYVAVVSAMLIFSDTIQNLCSESLVLKIIIFIIYAAAAVFAVNIFLCVFLIIFYQTAKRAKNCQIIVILGCRVKRGKPSKMLMQRIIKAFSEYQKNPGSVIIATGAKGNDETIAESLCQKQELIKLGVRAEDIFCEEKSTSTFENLKYAKEIIETNPKLKDIKNKNKIKIVTNGYHMFRSCELAKLLGFEACSAPSATSFYVIPAFYFREVLCIDKFMLEKYFNQKFDKFKRRIPNEKHQTKQNN